MVRTQIQLTEDQARRLRAAAARQNVSIADLVRRGVDSVLKDENGPTRAELVARAIAAAGRHRSDRQDVSVHHDRYLAEAAAE